MQRVNCDQRHSAAILAILNDAIVHSTALYDYRPRTLGMMETWFAAKYAGDFPVIGFEDDAGTLLGFASYGTFRAWPAFKYSIEHSVYVAPPFRGQGIGRRLLEEIIQAAQQQDYHNLVGCIDASNTVSVKLHLSLGFEKCATIKQAGFKFGRWLDLEFYQLLLPTPRRPVDG